MANSLGRTLLWLRITKYYYANIHCRLTEAVFVLIVDDAFVCVERLLLLLDGTRPIGDSTW